MQIPFSQNASSTLSCGTFVAELVSHLLLHVMGCSVGLVLIYEVSEMCEHCGKSHKHSLGVLEEEVDRGSWCHSVSIAGRKRRDPLALQLSQWEAIIMLNPCFSPVDVHSKQPSQVPPFLYLLDLPLDLLWLACPELAILCCSPVNPSFGGKIAVLF